MPQEIKIQKMAAAESAYLREALSNSIHVPDGNTPDESVLDQPEFQAAIEGWGRTGDIAFLAVDSARGNRPIGAAWVRLYTREQPTYGYIDDTIPALVISVSQDYRGTGFGTRLMTSLIADAREAGHPAISLSVDPNNRAAHLYQRLGFRPVDPPRLIANDSNPVMLLQL